MKHLTILFFLFLSFGASAQKANFKSSNAKHPAGIHTQFNCSLSEITSPEQVQTIVSRMKATPGLLKLDVLNQTAGTVDFIIITNEQNDLTILQDAFAAAGVARITYDGKKHKTTDLKKVISAKN